MSWNTNPWRQLGLSLGKNVVYSARKLLSGKIYLLSYFYIFRVWQHFKVCTMDYQNFQICRLWCGQEFNTISLDQDHPSPAQSSSSLLTCPSHLLKLSSLCSSPTSLRQIPFAPRLTQVWDLRGWPHLLCAPASRSEEWSWDLVPWLWSLLKPYVPWKLILLPLFLLDPELVDPLVHCRCDPQRGEVTSLRYLHYLCIVTYF